tara:strand:- start:34 stop:408 length:375 start_codon:yes stop_codon:yes gene_type:complete
MRNNQYTEKHIGISTYWRPKAGQRIKIKEMTHNHLKNSIKWWHNNSDFGSILVKKDIDTRWMVNKDFAVKELFLINIQRDSEQSKRIDANRCDCWKDNTGQATWECWQCEQQRDFETQHDFGCK